MQVANSNTNFKMNAIENLLKARNQNFVSIPGIREHIVAYLSSGKSMHCTQVFSKQGAKGTRPLLEKILDNSMATCKFQVPKESSIFISFDNIQKLYKMYRLGCKDKAIATVVTSVLCIMPDGPLKSHIQFDPNLSPENWLYKFAMNKKAQYTVATIDRDILKESLIWSDNLLNEIKTMFRKRLEVAIKKVEEEFDAGNDDCIDNAVEQATAKKRKICERGHVNENVRKNRKKCQTCNSNLKERSIHKNEDTDIFDMDEIIFKKKSKSTLHHSIENVFLESKPEAKSMGAIPLNPNTPDRIADVLEYIQKQCGIFNTYSTKVVFSNDGKVLKTETCGNKNGERKFIVVTADGLPYKIMIKLINDVFVCLTCKQEFKHIADITEHMKMKDHKEYFQKFGNILPNIGQFHYSLTMLRSYVKLVWNINLSELCKSIHFESPKAQYVQEKVKDFHKSLDTFRISQEAKLRELAYPFVKYARKNKVNTSIESYYLWKKWFVKNENYILVHDIEEVYGTSFSLYHSSIRANNFRYSEIAKQVFSPLFHVNNNSNYAVMDIHTQYLTEICSKRVPDLHEYLSLRKGTNFTGEKFNSEPYDERHEEYNKRGLNMFNIKSIEDFEKAFLLVDEFSKVKNVCFEDYNIKPHGGINSPNIPDYEPSIMKMRIRMRENNYLNLPEKETPLRGLGNKELLNPKLLQLFETAKKQKTENVLNVIRYNDFEKAFTTGVQMKVIKSEVVDKLDTNYEVQIRILIESEEDLETREMLREYFEKSQDHPSFSEEKFIDDILSKKFSFL